MRFFSLIFLKKLLFHQNNINKSRYSIHMLQKLIKLSFILCHYLLNHVQYLKRKTYVTGLVFWKLGDQSLHQAVEKSISFVAKVERQHRKVIITLWRMPDGTNIKELKHYTIHWENKRFWATFLKDYVLK